MYNRIPLTEVSVDLARLTTPERCLARARNPADWRLGELLAAVPFDLGLTVRHDPSIEANDFNPAHCLILGMGPNDMEQCDRMARQTRILTMRPS